MKHLGTSSIGVSSFTAASCPFLATHNSGARPPLSLESGLTPSFASSSFTAAFCPLPTAHDSGDRHSLCLKSGLTRVPELQATRRLVQIRGSSGGEAYKWRPEQLHHAKEVLKLLSNLDTTSKKGLAWLRLKRIRCGGSETEY